MIIGAYSLWKKFDLSNELRPLLIGECDKENISISKVVYSGHKTDDGEVRIFAQLAVPQRLDKLSAILLLPSINSTEEENEELMIYYAKRGFIVLMPNYTGRLMGVFNTPRENEAKFTVYPYSLSFANFTYEEMLDDMSRPTDANCWFEWAYVALYSIKYIKTIETVTSIGVVGIHEGGEIAWMTMLSSDVKCGVPIGAAGWRSYRSYNKYATGRGEYMSDERHAFIAGVEGQSYAQFVNCPVLLLSSLHDPKCDCDRIYDTYSRLGNKADSTIFYSLDSGACLGPQALNNMNLFLEKHLKGREIFIPAPVDVKVENVTDYVLRANVECDRNGIVEEVGVTYSEFGSELSLSAFRDWQTVFKTEGNIDVNSVIKCDIKAFEGAAYGFVYAYAKYSSGFISASKIVMKKINQQNGLAFRSKMLYSSGAKSFAIERYADYSLGGIFLENEAIPKQITGYGGIKGIYSVAGIKTYTVSSPKHLADENAVLKFDAYSTEDCYMAIRVETEGSTYETTVKINGGGKWKRIFVNAGDFKELDFNSALPSFKICKSLSFDTLDEKECAVTNILWL